MPMWALLPTRAHTAPGTHINPFLSGPALAVPGSRRPTPGSTLQLRSLAGQALGKAWRRPAAIRSCNQCTSLREGAPVHQAETPHPAVKQNPIKTLELKSSCTALQVPHPQRRKPRPRPDHLQEQLRPLQLLPAGSHIPGDSPPSLPCPSQQRFLRCNMAVVSLQVLAPL